MRYLILFKDNVEQSDIDSIAGFVDGRVENEKLYEYGLACDILDEKLLNDLLKFECVESVDKILYERPEKKDV